MSESVFLGFVVEYIFTEDPSDDQIRDAYLYATGLALCALTLPFVNAHGFLRAYMIGMDTRIITTSAIFQKVMYGTRDCTTIAVLCTINVQ